MADGNEDLKETSFENELGKNQQETESLEATSVKTNSRDAVDFGKEPINKNSDDLKAENTQCITSFKVPSTLQKDINPSKPVTAEKKEKVPELKYKEPWWSARPQTEENFSLEVLKNGCIISALNLNDKAYHVFGRLPSCDVVLEHPSISRYHALVQYRGETDGDKTLSGFYLYDLGSTHGTIVNKSKIKPKTYYRLKVGYVIKFGGSSRLFILQVCIVLFVSRHVHIVRSTVYEVSFVSSNRVFFCHTHDIAIYFGSVKTNKINKPAMSCV